MEFKGTKGKLKRQYVSGVCIGIGTKGDYSIMTANSILPETDEEYEKEREEIEANMLLYSKAPEMLEMLKKAKSALSRIKGSMMAHPDCTAGSEFDDYTSMAENLEDEIEKLIKKATTI